MPSRKACVRNGADRVKTREVWWRAGVPTGSVVFLLEIRIRDLIDLGVQLDNLTFKLGKGGLARTRTTIAEGSRTGSERQGTGHAGMISIEQNAIVKIFSVAAVVFLPPTLIASVYGMNFEHMPELQWVAGYPFAIGLMILCAILPYLFFKRRGWL